MSSVSFVMTNGMTVWTSGNVHEGDRQVAEEGKSYRGTAWASRVRKLPSHWENTQWDRACRDAKRRTRIYPAQPGETVVYVSFLSPKSASGRRNNVGIKLSGRTERVGNRDVEIVEVLRTELFELRVLRALVVILLVSLLVVALITVAEKCV